MQSLTAQELTTRAGRIGARLTAAFAPDMLEVVDESHLHAGHAGARPEGETHVFVRIRARALDALPRLDRHRAIHAELAEEFASGLHALRLQVETGAA